MRDVFAISEDPVFIRELRENLHETEYSIEKLSVETVLSYLVEGKGELVIVDASLEFIVLEQLCRVIRLENEVIGLLIYGRNLNDLDIKSLFEAGLDCYMQALTPIDQVALTADRICRRVEQIKKSNIAGLLRENNQAQDDLKLDNERRLIYKGEQPIKLTMIEYEMIKYFVERKAVAISRNELLDWIWGAAYVGDPKVIDVNVMRLRRKIEDDPKKPKYLCTVWGYGYRWEGA